MFKKIRLKLTLINASIMMVLFFVLILGAYYFAQIDMARRAEFMAHRIMNDIQTGIIHDLPLRNHPPKEPLPPGLPPIPPPDHRPAEATDNRLEPPPGPDFFFVKTTPSGMITFRSSNHSGTLEQLHELTQAVVQVPESEGTLTWENIKYSYFKSTVPDSPENVIIFRNLSQETQMLRGVLTALIVVGVVCSLLSFGASFFMAHRAMLPLQNSWQQQKNFISDASHELRTPLSIIQTNLDIVRSCPGETVVSQDKWLNNIQESSTHMANLIDALLFLARADSQQQVLEKELFSLNGALLRIVDQFEILAAAKRILLMVPAAESVDFCGDETRIKQVFGILLDNAIRHTPPNGAIEVSLAVQDANVNITVKDTGEGIAPEYLEKIFDRFYQVDTSRNKGGSGLGLAIAKWIVESHNGTIQAASTLGSGTTFFVRLPVDQQKCIPG